MKVYTYKEQEIPFPWPQGLLRLLGTVEAQDPDEADCIVVPPGFHAIGRDRSRNLKYMNGREVKHVFFNCSDEDWTLDLPCLVIRCNLKEKHLRNDPNSIPWPWPVDDLGAWHDPVGGLKYDVTFRGWNSCDARAKSVSSCSRVGLSHDTEMYDEFFGYYWREKRGKERRERFLNSLRDSRVVLAPRSIDGVFPYRFWEGMSVGRVTALVCSHYNLPWKDKIDWDRWCLQIPESDMREAGARIKSFLSGKSDEELLERGRYAREMWLRWMNPAKWPELMTEAVREKLLSLGLLRNAS